MTKDEVLARKIWEAALGHEEETAIDDVIQHRVFPPEKWAQQFIFERREGKNVTPQEQRAINLLERISEVATDQINKDAKHAVDKPDDNPD